MHGNFKGTEHFVWRIPRDPNCRSDTSNARVISRLNEQMDKYATIRGIFRELSGDSYRIFWLLQMIPPFYWI